MTTAPSRRDDPTITLRFSADEVLRHKDFAAYSASRAGRVRTG